MSQFQILGRRPFPFKAIPIRFACTSISDTITRTRKNNASERLNGEIRRRTRVVGTFPDGKSALMLVAARLKYIVENEWGRRRYLDVLLLEEKEGRM